MSRSPNRRARQMHYPAHPVKGYVSPNHPAATPYQELRVSKSPRVLFTVGLSVLVSAPFFALPFVIPAVVHPSLPAIAGMLAWSLALGVTCEWFHNWSLRRLEAETREIDRAAIGPTDIDGHYVGVAFADGFWSLNTSYSWDRGWLSVAPNGLVFEGRGSSFALPAYAIREVRLTKSSEDAVPSLRIFIDWAASDGETNTLSLEGRVFAKPKDKWQATERLFEEIRGTLAKHADQPLSPRWPPAVNFTRLRSDSVRLGGGDWRWIVSRSFGMSLAFATLCGALFWLMAVPFDQGIGNVLFALAVFLFLFSIYFYVRRYNRRLQAAPTPPTPLADRQEGG